MKILIVDDEPLVRKSLARVCAKRGHVVTEARDGVEGLEKWKADPPDLAFVDVLMPGMSGPDLLREIGHAKSERDGSTKAVLMSAFSGDHDMKKSMEAGADLFIPKPFDDVFEVVAMAEALCGTPSRR